MARLNKKLNLVFPFELESGDTGYVHSMPISRETFDLHFLVLSRTFANIYGQGLNFLVGPRVSMLMLRQVAEDMGIKDKVERELIAELHRLSNVVLPSDQGWQTMPLYDAIAQSKIDADARAELDNALVFFTLVSAVRGQRQGMDALEGMCALWGTQITPYSLMEYQSSLAISTATVTSQEMAVSSVPS